MKKSVESIPEAIDKGVSSYQFHAICSEDEILVEVAENPNRSRYTSADQDVSDEEERDEEESYHPH